MGTPKVTRRGNTVRVHVMRWVELSTAALAVGLLISGLVWFTLGIVDGSGNVAGADLVMVGSVPFWWLSRSSAVVLRPSGLRTPGYGRSVFWSWGDVAGFVVSERSTRIGLIRELRAVNPDLGEMAIWSSRVTAGGASAVDVVATALQAYQGEIGPPAE